MAVFAAFPSRMSLYSFSLLNVHSSYDMWNSPSIALVQVRFRVRDCELLSAVSRSAGRGLRYIGTLNRQGRNISQLATT
eukprot:scaffold3270_cov97-Skeletonema_dohrnii-CCMP3373.AAC.2